MATPYLWYTNFDNSATITNHGSGGAAYNGTATRNQYGKNSKGNAMWGPINGNSDGIRVGGGISSPYQHTWEFGVNIDQWWPGLGCNGIQWGNDGKLWAAGSNQFYGYLHGQASGCLSGYSDCYILALESEYNSEPSYSSSTVQFYLGTGANKPVKVPDAPTLDEGQIAWDFQAPCLSLHTDYYFQISINVPNPSQWAANAGIYSIGNCIGTGSPCADDKVTGFPCGCYIYCWREYNSAIDLSGGGDWAADVPIWAGGTPPTPGPSPTPGPGPGSSTNINMNASVREWQPGFD